MSQTKAELEQQIKQMSSELNQTRRENILIKEQNLLQQVRDLQVEAKKNNVQLQYFRQPEPKSKPEPEKKVKGKVVEGNKKN